MVLPDKIILTNKEIRKFDLLGQQLIHGSITVNEATLELRGGNLLIDLAAIMLFIDFRNWLDGTRALQTNLSPHMDRLVPRFLESTTRSISFEIYI